MTKQEILESSLDARQKEIAHYQINIDNYTLALVEIRKLPDAEQSELQSFADQLRGLLVSEKLEQKKAKIMLEVVKQQLE